MTQPSTQKESWEEELADAYNHSRPLVDIANDIERQIQQRISQAITADRAAREK